MSEWILANTPFMPNWLQMLLLSAIPLTELRASIPLAFTLMKDAWGWNWWQIYLLAVAGNMLPVPFVLWLLGPVSRFLSRWRPFKRFFDWVFERARRRAGSAIEKYEALGLAVFVAIPLPMTGAWSGCAAAFLFGIPFRLALPSIALGVAVAGALVTLMMTGAIAGASFFLG
ncbi:MAG TPA: small multi-drug export protein [Candidatus Fermentibacter daniensis]|nr:small multi-drug export protein [Candidatus Fermentibacter daniensis]HOR06851.1 small multi-drug export protein [Candidatus Fermentibacter daniensis]HPK51080.1 small multi-drug export protein [Candidatus Fermentibacter daniensis]HQE56486.1 small multi-drug export protein [Candidatus Fermentibacter daniensis]HQH92110.1 small multi-drug export protein [Candidatus Fermentibacter daniensis]